MKSKILKFVVGILALASLTGCGKGYTCVTRTPEEANIDFPDTPVTDKLKLPYTDEQLASKRFAFNDRSETEKDSDGVGFVSLRSCVDGDTANFTQDDLYDPISLSPYTLKTRFLGINTPESTAQIDPWGKKASRFTRAKLEAAQADADQETAKQGKKVHNIVLITDKKVNGIFESSGRRWLAFVWYRPTFNADFRLLNLELVEQGYSQNLLFDDSKITNYRSAFEKAEERPRECGYRIHGEIDDGFDYVKKEYLSTLWNVVNNYDKVGADEESGASGVRLHVVAQVIAMQGDSLVLRDVVRDSEQDPSTDLQTLFAFAGYNSGLASIFRRVSPETEGLGIVISIYCNATKNNGGIQLSGLEVKTTGVKERLQIVTAKNAYDLSGHNYDEFELTMDAITFAPSTIKKVEDLHKYHYTLAETEIEIRTVTPQTDDGEGAQGDGTNEYWARGNLDKTAWTIYGYVRGTKVPFNIRINSTLVPTLTPDFFDEKWDTASFDVKEAVGRVFRVKGYVVPYFEGSQMTLNNNYRMYNYIERIA